MTVEELIEKLKEFYPHMLIEPEVFPNYEGQSIVSLYPKHSIDYDSYEIDDYDSYEIDDYE